MLKKTFTVVLTLLVLSPLAGFAELSSKAKRAEKLVTGGNIAGAMEIYKELIDRNAKNPALLKEGQEGMARCLVLQAKAATEKKQFADAKTAAETVLTAYPDTAAVKDARQLFVGAQVELGKELIAEGKYDDCMTQSKEALEKVSPDPESVAALGGVMGTCLYEQGKKVFEDKRFQEAAEKFVAVIKDYAQSEKLNDAKADLAETLYQLGLTAQDQKNFKDALAAFQKVLKDFADQAAVVAKTKQAMEKAGTELFKVADDAIKSQKFDEAFKTLETALAASTDDAFTARCKYTMAVCLRAAKQDDKALALYQEVAANYKNTPSAAAACADMYDLYLKQDNKKEALNAIQQAVALAPDNSDYLFKEAELLKELGNQETAQKAYSKLLGMLQNDIQKTYVGKEELQYKLGKTYLSLGSYAEASVEFDKALNRNSAMTPARIGLASAQFNDKNFSGASSTYAALIKQLSSEFEEFQKNADKNSADAMKKMEDFRKQIAYFHYQNGLACEQLGDYNKALEECRLGLEGVSTQEAAATLKRIQAAQQKAPAPAEKK